MAGTRTVHNAKTDGFSPKVYVPALLGVVVGVILLLTDEHTVGVTVLIAALGHAGIGIAASPGKVKVRR